ncbi:MAG: hypothetical protein R6U10_02430 [Thermoplasmatota archaeon]
MLDDTRYTQAGEQAMAFIWRHLQADGGILHRYRGGHVMEQRFATDFAFVIWALIELYMATFAPIYLERAIQVQEDMFERFWDTEDGGFFLTEQGSDVPLTRSKPTEDGALPSANAVAMYNLLRLGHLTGDPRWGSHAEELRMLSAPARRWPTAHAMWLSALEMAFGTPRELVVTAPRQEDAMAAIRTIQRHYLPHTVILLKADGIEDVAPYTASLETGEEPTFYVCTGQACRAPTARIDEALDELDPPVRHTASPQT